MRWIISSVRRRWAALYCGNEISAQDTASASELGQSESIISSLQWQQQQQPNVLSVSQLKHYRCVSLHPPYDEITLLGHH